MAALLTAFDRAGFEQLARFHLNEDFEEIAGGGNLRQMAFSLVEWATSHGRLPDLVAGALAENPGNPELHAFNAEIWTRALAGDAAVLAQPGDLPDVAMVDERRRSFGTPVIVGALIAIVAIAGVAWFVLGNRGGGLSPQVSLANASLSARAVDENGHDVFDIGFQITMDNYETSSVVVEAAALDATSLQPIDIDAPPSQRFRPDLPHEAVRGTFRFRYPHKSQCIFVRIVAFDGATYSADNAVNNVELTRTQTPRFDAWKPANPSCSQEAT